MSDTADEIDDDRNRENCVIPKPLTRSVTDMDRVRPPKDDVSESVEEVDEVDMDLARSLSTVLNPIIQSFP